MKSSGNKVDSLKIHLVEHILEAEVLQIRPGGQWRVICWEAILCRSLLLNIYIVIYIVLNIYCPAGNNPSSVQYSGVPPVQYRKSGKYISESQQGFAHQQ